MDTSSRAVSGGRVTAVAAHSKQFYDGQKDLTFHNWSHVTFVRVKAIGFARENGADTSLVETAALVHDLNYLEIPNSRAAAGAALRRAILKASGVAENDIARIELIVREAEIRGRRRDVSLEAQALSDADTLYKILPITPVLLSPEYMRENRVSIFELAKKIVEEQDPIQRDGYLFYSSRASAQYERWAEANLELWRCIAESVDDVTVQSLISALPPSR